MNPDDKTDAAEIDPAELLDTLCITRIQRRSYDAGGTWVRGTIAGHRFGALVFPDPAVHREWEVEGNSRISKLHVERLQDRETVYSWDRGADLEPRTEMAGVIVSLLAAGLADYVWDTPVESSREEQ